MTKRVVATLLWFYAGWYAGAMIAELFGISAALGPIFGVAAAGIVGGDPRGVIWGRRKATQPGLTADGSAGVPTVSSEPVHTAA